MSQLKSITETCVPRPDVLGGKLADNHFAAQLDQVVRNPDSYPIYGDADQFFELTYPTAGLKRLLETVFGRLSGSGSRGSEHGFVRLETSFGGGKTHSLMAVYHLAKGARPGNVDEFIVADSLPEKCKVAAVVADTLDPVNGLETNGVRTWTIWGEIGAQLGPEAFAQLKASDESRTAPGKGTWESVVGDEPTIIIIDELVQHLRQLTSSGDENVRRVAEAIPPFLKNLYELAAGSPNLVVLLTLATQADAYGDQTNELAETISSFGAQFGQTLSDTQSLVSRASEVIKPADDVEIAEILKRRIFASIDQKAAAKAGDIYAGFYSDLIGRGESLAGGADRHVSYGVDVKRSYPFHPELIRVLDKRIGTIPNFQRARGALRLIAEVVAGIWDKSSNVDIINVADIDYSRAEVLSLLTVGLGRESFDQVAKADFVGPGSHAARVDATRFVGRPEYGTRVCRTVFAHSLEMTTNTGAGRGDYVIGTVRPGDDPEVLAEALAEVERVAWHLALDGTRWRFMTEPNANKIIAEEMKNVSNARAWEDVEDLIRKTFPSDGAVKAIHFPGGPGDVPDEASLRVAVMHHDSVLVRADNALPPLSQLVRIRDYAGMGEGIRGFRNSVVFLVGDEDLKDAMRDRMKASIAVSGLVTDADRLSSFSKDVQSKLRAAADTAKLEARVAVTRCFKHLYYPWSDKSNDYLKHIELSPRTQGDTPQAQTKAIIQILTDEAKIRTQAIATNYLESKTWPKDAAEITVKELSSYFWRDHSAPIVLDPGLIREAVRAGVANGSWVYFDPGSQQAWTQEDAAPPVDLTSDAILYTHARAAELSLIKKELTWKDVLEDLKDSTKDAETLRASLSGSLGRDVSVDELRKLLVGASEAGKAGRVALTEIDPATGTPLLGPADVSSFQLDVLFVTPMPTALRIGLDFGEEREHDVTSEGDAGPAFASLRDKAVESGAGGLVSLAVTALAEPGEGHRDLALLGTAIGMLPGGDIEVGIDVAMDFETMRPGIEIRLSGPAADYQQIEDHLIGLAKEASKVAGKLTLTLRFEPPLDPEGAEYGRIQKVLQDLSPGKLKLHGVMA